MKLTYLWKVFLLISILFSASYPQKKVTEITIPFRLASGDTVTINGLDSLGVIYLELNDFLKVLQYPASIDDSRGKIECLIASQLVRFTNLSPFVIITERISNTSTVYQMARGIARRQNDFFIPIFAFLPLYEGITQQKLTFDANRKMLLLPSPSAPEKDIAGIDIEKKLNGYLITILANNKLGDVESWLKPDGWLFVTITGATVDTAELERTKPVGVVKRILAFQSPTSVQLTFLVSLDVEQAEVTADQESNNLFISLRTRTEAEKKEIERKKQEIARQSLDRERTRWNLDVIVIDAGHGGKDPGTIGVLGTREKDITLDVALRLGQLLEKNFKGIKIVYTRKTDQFVELYRRTQIANEAGGKLFVSIHCNSMEHKPSRMNGFEIYLLRPGLTEDAIAIASRENSVIQLEEGYEERYRKLTEEEFIIVTMAQSAYMKYSEQFAEITASTMAKNLKIKNSGVKQAGFYVLVGASMPNVLVELGYLSNKREEQFLRSHNGKKKISEAIFKGIKDYKLKYEKALQEGVKEKPH
jgi:N-acetylmuramoyl-L-alanine amidase